MTSTSKLWAKLRNKKYRRAFVATQLKRGVPLQIKALRQRLGITQKELAECSDLKQGTISRCEDPDYGELTFNTVLAIANGLDMAFVGKFVPFSELIEWQDRMFEHAAEVATFEEEDTQLVHQRTSASQPFFVETRKQSSQQNELNGVARLLARPILYLPEFVQAAQLPNQGTTQL